MQTCYWASLLVRREGKNLRAIIAPLRIGFFSWDNPMSSQLSVKFFDEVVVSLLGCNSLADLKKCKAASRFMRAEELSTQNKSDQCILVT